MECGGKRAENSPTGQHNGEKEFKKPAGSWSCALKPRSSYYRDGIGKVANRVDRGHEFQSLVFASLDCG